MKINLRIVFFRLKACGAGFALFVFVMALSSVSALYAQNGTGVGGAVRAETVGSPEKMTVKGVVVDKETGETMIGVSIRVLGTDVITVTDIDGAYSLTLPKGRYKVVFTYIGYEKLERELDASHTESFKKVVMAPASKTMNEVVVTGIYQRKKESFTGSAATFEGPELKKIGVQNVLQSLKTLDPSFKIADNIQFGSDPNRMPDIEIRGKSSVIGLKEEYGTDPNQPLFILDGFETTAEKVMDMDMTRIESITILKDAAAKALYGSKAANGVILITTKQAKKGAPVVKLSANFGIQSATYVPDVVTDPIQYMNMRNQAELNEGKLTVTYNRDDILEYEEGMKHDKYIYPASDWYDLCYQNGFLQQYNARVSGGTDNHLMLVDLREEECTGKELEARLDSVHITANKNTVPGETRSPFVTSGVRLGTPAVTTRGMGEAEMKVIADCIADCIWHYDEKKDDISARVLALTKAFPLYE